MEIKNLRQTSLNDIVQCITDSFSDYFVQLPADVAYWEKRFQAARVDYSLSYGMFDQGRLTGFIINGIDELQGKRTAYNTGTGVTKEARGHKIIDQLYEHAIPLFREQGIVQCTLEVIRQNERAIHVYERIGFHISKTLKCFKGNLEQQEPGISSRRIPYSEIAATAKQYDNLYSWDNTAAAVMAAGDQYHCYEVAGAATERLGYFVLNPSSGQLIQFETLPGLDDRFPALLSGIAAVSPAVKINNVDGERTQVAAALSAAGLDNFIDQYEMKMKFN